MLCVCRMRASLGAEPTFVPSELRWCRSWRRWSGRTWSSMTWCCSSWGPCSCAPGMSTTARWGQSSWCHCTTWRSVRSALLTPVTRYQSCGTDGGIYGEFSGESPEKMSPFCKESSDLEPKCHLIFLGPSGENFILVNQQFAFMNPWITQI